MTLVIPSHVPSSKIRNCWPVNDLRDHDINSRGNCWCKPRIEEDDFGYVVVHNSMDGREAYEHGKRKLN